MNYTVELTEDEVRVLDSWIGEDQIQPWLQHAIKNKARQRIDASIMETTDRNPKKMTEEAKLALIKKMTLPTRAERDKQNDRKIQSH